MVLSPLGQCHRQQPCNFVVVIESSRWRPLWQASEACLLGMSCHNWNDSNQQQLKAGHCPGAATAPSKPAQAYEFGAGCVPCCDVALQKGLCDISTTWEAGKGPQT